MAVVMADESARGQYACKSQFVDLWLAQVGMCQNHEHTHMCFTFLRTTCVDAMHRMLAGRSHRRHPVSRPIVEVLVALPYLRLPAIVGGIPYPLCCIGQASSATCCLLGPCSAQLVSTPNRVWMIVEWWKSLLAQRCANVNDTSGISRSHSQHMSILSVWPY